MAAVIEVRTYRTVPGARATLIEALLARSFPAFRDIGMRLLGPFPSVEDDDTFVWLRAFPDAASREPMKDVFYEGALWQDELEAELLPLVADFEVTLVDDAVGLWALWPETG